MEWNAKELFSNEYVAIVITRYEKFYWMIILQQYLTNADKYKR